MPLMSKLTSPRGSEIGTLEQRRPTSKFFFSEIGRDRALSFGMYHLLVDFYQFYSYDASDLKTGSSPGAHKLEQ